MTANELRKKFNDDYGIDDWPTTYEVDAETYGNVCQHIFDYLYNQTPEYWGANYVSYQVKIGPNQGILFKNVELILKEDKS